MEWKLFGDSVDYISAEWYSDRESAHHLEESNHSERLSVAKEFISKAVELGGKSISDLGCGDGGLLSILSDLDVKSWGYDLAPNNVEYAVNVRKVDARYTDFNSDDVEYGDITVMTEVLEHMEDPHSVLKDLPSKYIVVSSPYNESNLWHYEFHLWAWDDEGYSKFITDAGYKILDKRLVSGWSQVVLAVRD